MACDNNIQFWDNDKLFTLGIEVDTDKSCVLLKTDIQDDCNKDILTFSSQISEKNIDRLIKMLQEAKEKLFRIETSKEEIDDDSPIDGIWSPHTVIDVKKDEKDGQILSFDDNTGWYLSSSRNPGNILVSRGDKAELKLRNCTVVVGLKINGKYVFEMTVKDKYKERIEETRKYKKEQDEDYQKFLKTFDERLEKIHPALYKDFRELKTSAYTGSEDYYGFIFEEATKMLKVFKTPDECFNFRNLSYEEQLKVVPDLSPDHSGNTLASATSIAKFIISGEAKEKEESLC